jgi:hypothetical protein
MDSAEIIAFPRPAPPRPAQPDQLQIALARLEAALEAQSEAVAQWRASLGKLRDSVGGLGTAVHRFQDSLAGLHTEVEHVNGEAKRLEAWAGTAPEAASR